ncbi:8-amino-7-oxononanoate synthase [Polaromonas vacuolata]|uniref:8-amino-7-oxononanoate synthase n=1 Tax=Polaromonas vacuolata TaxID=37448 RepID=A0A6H2HB57_9BURK|nr:hypothetical protein [Polaromonas vacuolata]QJC57112.1 8-amino-7-oxononanoate synthase [Polaromonas vacuolata]
MKTQTVLGKRIKDRNFAAAYTNIAQGRKSGISHLCADNQASFLPHIYMNEKDIVSFDVADYLGLSSHPALRAGAHKAIDDFGIQLASSRVYLSSPLYQKLEN